MVWSVVWFFLVISNLFWPFTKSLVGFWISNFLLPPSINLLRTFIHFYLNLQVRVTLSLQILKKWLKQSGMWEVYEFQRVNIESRTKLEVRILSRMAEINPITSLLFPLFLNPERIHKGLLPTSFNSDLCNKKHLNLLQGSKLALANSRYASGFSKLRV